MLNKKKEKISEESHSTESISQSVLSVQKQKEKGCIQFFKDCLFFIISGYGKYLMKNIGYFPSHFIRNTIYKYIMIIRILSVKF